MNTNARILIVDDEAVVRDSLADWFRAEGYETVGFEQDPQCWGEPNCQLPPKLVQFVIAAVQ